MDYREPLQQLQAKTIDGGAVTKYLKGLGLSSDFASRISLQRTVLSSWLQSTDKTVSKDLLEGLASLVSHINTVLAQVAATPNSSQAFNADWSSPLSKSEGSRFFRLDNIRQEAAMVYFAYGAAARQLGLQKAMVSFGAGDAAGGVADTVAAVALLRQAAGILACVGEQLLPQVQSTVQSWDRFPLELHVASARCLTSLCLAEAQEVTVQRALNKKSGNLTLAALEAGCVQLFEEAKQVASELVPLHVSDALQRYLAASTQLHRCRCLKWQATEFYDQGEMGKAEACAQEAIPLLEPAIKAAGAGSAGQRLQAEKEQLGLLRNKANKDRLQVTYQPLPSTLPEPPAAKVLVQAVPFTPVAAEDHAAQEQQEQQGSCSVQ